MEMGIQGKVAAVAASSQGLGFACAMGLAREGASIAICSRDRERIDEAARVIHEETGAVVYATVVDVSRQEECIRFVDETVKQFGGLDILVTNTGGPVPGALDEINFDHVRDGFDSTLMSAIVMMKTTVPHMRKKGFGRIINILSMTVKQPKVNLLVSNTMRPAILGFAKSISFELAGKGITVNNVAPGYTKTERLTELAEHLAAQTGVGTGDIYEGWERTVPAHRLGKPEELAAVVTFLASEKASYVTGVTLQVDGGAVAGLL
jgi:3-oxoacyl-[acyl-carrier protein] reductase